MLCIAHSTWITTNDFIISRTSSSHALSFQLCTHMADILHRAPS